jgi:hypothetical protein
MLSCVLLQEDRYCKQRLKVFWIKDGDKNNKFFHAFASAKWKRNTTKMLCDTNNNIMERSSFLFVPLLNNISIISTCRKMENTHLSFFTFLIAFLLLLITPSQLLSAKRDSVK